MGGVLTFPREGVSAWPAGELESGQGNSQGERPEVEPFAPLALHLWNLKAEPHLVSPAD